VVAYRSVVSAKLTSSLAGAAAPESVNVRSSLARLGWTTLSRLNY